jgi:UDP-3-O-[3-hydroxymyristoyl] glucosamine N-acyltransferase
MIKHNKNKIHPTALLVKDIVLGKDVTIEAYSVVGQSEDEDNVNIHIGDDTIIGHHSIIYNNVIIGSEVVLDPFSRVGPNAKIGDRSKILYGARVHEEAEIGKDCSIAGNCPDRTSIGDNVIHLGRIAHSYYHPFAEWDEPQEPGPSIGSKVIIGVESLIIGPVSIGDNVFIFPKEIVRSNLPNGGIYKDGRWKKMPNWSKYLNILGKLDWKPRLNDE